MTISLKFFYLGLKFYRAICFLYFSRCMYVLYIFLSFVCRNLIAISFGSLHNRAAMLFKKTILVWILTNWIVILDPGIFHARCCLNANGCFWEASFSTRVRGSTFTNTSSTAYCLPALTWYLRVICTFIYWKKPCVVLQDFW